MNLYFDKNYELDYMVFNCYVGREHQTEVPQSFILTYLKEFDCEKHNVPLSNIAEIISYKGRDCNLLGFADVNCFIDSFNNCIPAMIKNTHTTIEGDPIYNIAMIKSNIGSTLCSIVVFEDTTNDRFGIPGITKYSCSSLTSDDEYLDISPCVDESNQGEYGFLIPKPD
jgi:hypothetical protein